MNISKSGVGFSWGIKGLRTSISPTGQVRTTTSIPGTGISYTQNIGNVNKKRTEESAMYGLALHDGRVYVRTDSHDRAIWENSTHPHVWKTLHGVTNARDRIQAQAGDHRGQDIRLVQFEAVGK